MKKTENICYLFINSYLRNAKKKFTYLFSLEGSIVRQFNNTFAYTQIFICSVISKVRNIYLWRLFAELINFTQPVYVWRDDPDSRQNTIKEIINRATSDLDWPQILIFPEGTCTNRSCLITFKPGAFYPGVPIQPVCIRYPNKLDTVTWTWEGPSA